MNKLFYERNLKMLACSVSKSIHVDCRFPYFTTKEFFTSKSSCFSNIPLKDIGFGIVFDIDGVLTRGNSVISAALQASDLLSDKNGDWRVPVLFLTNAANVSNETKAAELSQVLHRRVLPSEIVSSHTALRLYSTYFDKHVAVCGHGPVKTLAHSIGFRNCSTIDEISSVFPWLDACKPRKHLYTGKIGRVDFGKIEAVILLGEPERWEHCLQILLDILVQHGDLNKTPEEFWPQFPLPQLPIFACGSDLVWATNAPSPRIALGSFLTCLESLYERITGRRLAYTGLLGKPSPLSYAIALVQLNAIAVKHFGVQKPLKRIYCIGDNPEVDVYGANLFNHFLSTVDDDIWCALLRRVDELVREEHAGLFAPPTEGPRWRWGQQGGGGREGVRPEAIEWSSLVRRCESMPVVLRQLMKRPPLRQPLCSMEPILVTSGVYQEQSGEPIHWLRGLHRDFPDLEHLFTPRFVTADVAEAVSSILSIEESLSKVGYSTVSREHS